MAIAVSCKCGKKFKVKDHLAGKAVRCPECKNALRIPVGDDVSTSTPARAKKGGDPPKGSGGKEETGAVAIDSGGQAPLSAEDEARLAEERNKLIASYDQFAGRKTKGRAKTGEITSGKKKKLTFFMKVADGCGVVCSTLAFKYIFVVVLFGGGIVALLVGGDRVLSYVRPQAGPPPSKEVRCEECFEKAEAAIAEGDWVEANKMLKRLIEIDPRKEVHRRYLKIKKAAAEGLNKEH